MQLEIIKKDDDKIVIETHKAARIAEDLIYSKDIHDNGLSFDFDTDGLLLLHDDNTGIDYRIQSKGNDLCDDLEKVGVTTLYAI